MEKPFPSRLVGQGAHRARNIRLYPRKGKKDDNQLAFAFPAVQLSLPLEMGRPLFLPRRRNINEWEVEGFWLELISQKGFLRQWAKDQVTKKRQGYGLIYLYCVGGKIRYIGKTRQDSLLKRIQEQFPSGIAGYDYDIKRCLLNAAWSNKLSIRTELVSLKKLEQREEKLIHLYAPFYRLWNKLHNQHFRESNFDI